MSDTNIVPFGKYKGRPIEEVIETDPSYLHWLAGQDWFRARYVSLHQTITPAAFSESQPAAQCATVRDTMRDKTAAGMVSTAKMED